MQWDISSKTTNLNDKNVHIWMVNLQEHYITSDYYSKFLSKDEILRVDRYVFEKDRRYFTIGRGVLRVLAGQYISLNPQDIIFAYGPYGKPYLDSKIQKKSLHFNVSHSGDLALYIFSTHGEVGIDIEIIKHIDGFEDIAKNFFSKKENIILKSASDKDRLEIFFEFWTRKEAFVKAIGIGLSCPEEDKVALVDKLQLLYLKPYSGYVGACFFANSTKTIRYFKF